MCGTESPGAAGKDVRRGGALLGSSVAAVSAEFDRPSGGTAGITSSTGSVAVNEPRGTTTVSAPG